MDRVAIFDFIRRFAIRRVNIQNTIFDLREVNAREKTVEFFGTNHRRDTRLKRKILNERKFHSC